MKYSITMIYKAFDLLKNGYTVNIYLLDKNKVTLYPKASKVTISGVKEDFLEITYNKSITLVPLESIIYIDTYK